MLPNTTAWRAVVLASLCLYVPQPAMAGEGRARQRIMFERKVVNLEYSAFELRPVPPKQARAPSPAKNLYYGLIMRRLPGDGPRTAEHYIAFCAQYRNGVAAMAWCDENANGDMADDPPITLSGHPRSPSARAFLVDLRWTAQAGWRKLPVNEKIRVILEPPSRADGLPEARVQRVHGMVGSANFDGKKRDVVLFDGSGNGIYTADFGDGCFVDLDGDRNFVIDQLAPEFVPFGVPVPVGGRRYLASVDPQGAYVDLEDLGEAPPSTAVQVGMPAPDFEYRDLNGTTSRLSDRRGHYTAVYFWATWCGNCTAQGPLVQELGARYQGDGLRVLGVSYDTDRAAMERFRKEHRLDWPTTFSGRMLWEDPIGRLYRVDAPGVLYLIAPDGKLEGIYQDPEGLDVRLSQILKREAGLGRKE